MQRKSTLDRRSPDFHARRSRLSGLNSDIGRALHRFEGSGIERKSALGRDGRPPAPGIDGREPSGGAEGPPGASGVGPAAGTRAMLARMRAVLARELDGFCDRPGGEDPGAGEAGGKAAVDLMSLIVRTLERIDQLERVMAADEGAGPDRDIDPDERQALRARVRGIVERLARERLAELMAAVEAPVLPACGGDVSEGDKEG